MIDKSVVKRLAIQCGAELLQSHWTKSIKPIDEGYFMSEEELQAFAQAVIEDYKAGLVPVAWLVTDRDDTYTTPTKETYKGFYTQEPLYALKETK